MKKYFYLSFLFIIISITTSIFILMKVKNIIDGDVLQFIGTIVVVPITQLFTFLFFKEQIKLESKKDVNSKIFEEKSHAINNIGIKMTNIQKKMSKLGLKCVGLGSGVFESKEYLLKKYSLEELGEEADSRLKALPDVRENLQEMSDEIVDIQQKMKVYNIKDSNELSKKLKSLDDKIFNMITFEEYAKGAYINFYFDKAHDFVFKIVWGNQDGIKFLDDCINMLDELRFANVQ